MGYPLRLDQPIAQAELADATGTSSVHRLFQALRADGLIQTKGK